MHNSETAAYVLLSLGVFAFLSALNLTPFVRDLSRRWGLVDNPDHLRKLHRNPIPRTGGVAVLLAYFAAFGATLLGFKNAEFVLPRDSSGWGLLAAILIVFATGLLDDLLQLKAWQKLAGQLLAAGVAYAAGVQIHVLRGHTIEPWISVPVTLLWLAVSTNAFNLIDGLDGLAAGAGLFATITVIVAALSQEDLALAIATVPLAGCLLGFLRFNFNPASVFLGDCGSLSIGFFLGCCGVLWGQKSATVLGMVAPLMAMVIPLLDVSLSIGRRFLRRQPIFGADRRHIHHLLLARGLTPRRAALLLYGMCALAAVFSLIEHAFHNRFGGLIVILFCAGAWLGIQHLDYWEFGTAAKLLLKGSFRGMVDVQCRVQQFENLMEATLTAEECWAVILGACRDFGFTGVRLNLSGEVMESIEQPQIPGAWQLRIPLPDTQYVNLYRNADSDTEGFAEFAASLERSLHRKLPALGKARSEVAAG